MSNRARAIVFTLILCIVCSLMLTAASSGLKRFHLQNMRLDRQQNILRSVGLISPDKTLAAKAVEQMYVRNIQELRANPSGEILSQEKAADTDLPIFLYRTGQQIKAYIVPINSRGLWGRILGYLAIETDGRTILGFTVYQHAETPGLGGEIENNWFQQNFVGKTIVDPKGNFESITIAKGLVKDRIPREKQPHYVDGISGATLTGKFLSAGLKENLLAYEPVFSRFRKQTAK